MQDIDFMIQASRGFIQQAGAFMPRLAIALGVLLVGLIVAKVARFSVVKALRAMNFHVLTERAGIDAFLQQGGTEKDTSKLFGWMAYVVAILASLVIAFNSLGLAQVADLLSKTLLYVPKVLVALFVVILGSYFGRFGGNAVRSYCRGAGISDADLLGRVMQYGIMVFVLLLAVDHLDIGSGLIQQTFLILLAGVILALALSFGLGGRDRAAALIERWFPRNHGNGDR